MVGSVLGKPIRLLILGGTGFIGRHQVHYALARGHQVSVFSRGHQEEALPSPVEQLRGNRDRDMHALRGRTWDACIDNPTRLPVWVRRTADVLTGNIGHYVFVSTISVYASNDHPADETALLSVYKGVDSMAETTETLRANPQLYGPLKALCEAETRSSYGDAATSVVRPGLIVGPGDETDRFTYWPVKLSSGKEVLAPGDGSDPVQFIDVRDLAEWTVRLAEDHTSGVFNAIGPHKPTTMLQMLTDISEGLQIPSRLVWAANAFLNENGVAPWSDMPVWVPGQGNLCGFHRRQVSRAVGAGLTFRPISLTAIDTLTWFCNQPSGRQAHLRAGLTVERERELLAELRAVAGSTC